VITYTGKNPEYYSVHFNNNNSLIWSRQPGDYSGQWMLDGKHLTISLETNSVKIQADISNDNKLENITDNTANYEINSGQLIINPKLPLQNTVWKGMWSAAHLQLNFFDDTKMKAGTEGFFNDLNYTRTASGAVIRFSPGYDFMGIIISDSVMKGGDKYNGVWEVLKQ
jgi:hypothetical protein